jgi:hypothetical protein
MFFSKTAIGEVVSVQIGKTLPDNNPIPVLVIRSISKSKQLKTFFLGEAPADTYKGVTTYFKVNPLVKNTINLVCKKGKYTYGISIDANEHMVALTGMIKCRRVTVVHEDNKMKPGTRSFELDFAANQFEQEIKEPLLIRMLAEKLKQGGKDPAMAASLVPKTWAAFEKEWQKLLDSVV